MIKSTFRKASQHQTDQCGWEHLIGWLGKQMSSKPGPNKKSMDESSGSKSRVPINKTALSKIERPKLGESQLGRYVYHKNSRLFRTPDPIQLHLGSALSTVNTNRIS